MLAPLATPDDLAARLGVVLSSGVQWDRASALLDDASADVRNYTRQQFTVGTETAILEATTEQWLYMPQRPVRTVSAVLAGAAPLSAGMWRLQNDALYRWDGWNSRFYGATSPWNQPNTISVTYTFGYDEIPADVVKIVCKLAQMSWVNPQGMREYRLDNLQVTLATETVGLGALDAADMKVLDYYRRVRRSTKLNAQIL